MQSVIISNIKDNAYMADVTFPIENNKLTAILRDIEIPYIFSKQCRIKEITYPGLEKLTGQVTSADEINFLFKKIESLLRNEINCFQGICYTFEELDIVKAINITDNLSCYTVISVSYTHLILS